MLISNTAYYRDMANNYNVSHCMKYKYIGINIKTICVIYKHCFSLSKIEFINLLILVWQKKQHEEIQNRFAQFFIFKFRRI